MKNCCNSGAGNRTPLFFIYFYEVCRMVEYAVSKKNKKGGNYREYSS
ncbi:hypothetical protein EDD76_10758 [Kineothrix alysoides]|uniref:Uncharacterized protein n=1 Tax=Kineothrix alysoides TaxID=1469948 RepID=A0A4R1QYA8_9FIRM|nr:hypothetical protein EDD76_10758 [Kineothrix alysoides]